MLDRLPIQKYPDLGASTVELSILMPCLNEAETLATCIGKAKKYLIENDIAGEHNLKAKGKGSNRRNNNPHYFHWV